MMYQANQQLRQQQQQQQQMNMNNMSNNMNRITPYNLNNENGIKTRLPNLRYHVFISKETTKELSDYILPEPWGEENGLLYKYLDYVWRCQLFDGEIKKFYCRNEGKLVFHSGLQRRSDGEFVYLLLIRNDADSQKKVDQKWRVALGIQNGLHSRNMSFVTKEELLKHYWPNHDMLGQLLPKRTLFYQSEKDLIFNRGYRFEIDWEERLRTCKNRIYKTLSNYGNRKGASNNIDEHILPLTELQRRFESETSKSILMSRANPRIGVPQAFIESKNGGYRLELLIPLTLYYMNRTYYFALALRPHHEQKIYEGMSILTREMAYANARLVGTIDSCWLTTKFANDNHGPAQHCSCTCHTYCNQGINPMHIHNLSDHKRKYSNDIPHDPDHNHNCNHNNNACKNNKNIQTNNVPLLNKSHSIDSNPYLNCNNPNNQNNNNRNPRNNPTQNRIQYTPINTMINQYNPYNGMNTTNRTNPFSFVQTNNAHNANSINPYSANNAYQNSFNLSILTNPAFIASVPNVANVANVNVGHHVSPSRVHNHNISKMIPFINNMNNMNNMNVGNASLAAYGIPTIGPLTTNMPVAQIAGPQSIGSSVTSSVPIYPNQHPQQQHPQIINAFSNTVNTINKHQQTINSINKHFNQNNNYYHQYHNHNNPNQNKIIVIKPKENTVCIISNEEAQAKKDQLQPIRHNNNNNDSAPKIDGNQNEHNNNIDKDVEDEKKIEAEAEAEQIEEEVEEETETEPDEEDDDDDDEEEEAVNVEVEPLGVEVGSDAVPEQKGFTDDMFADASPRTKELFDGLTFDEEDEVYSLGTPPIKSHNKKAIPRAKSFHTNLHHPDLYTVNNRKSSSYGSLRNKYNESLQQQHSRYMTMTGRDTSPFHLKSIDDTARQHSHDGMHGIHRTKSEQNIVLANAHNNYHHRYGNNEGSNNQNNQNQNLMYQEYYYQAPQPDYTGNDSTLYASDFHNQSGLYYNNNNNNNENDKNLKARMIKSHSLPSLKVVNDMMSMHSQHQQFQQFQQLNQQKQTQHHQREQLASPIQENHATQMIDIYGD